PPTAEVSPLSLHDALPICAFETRLAGQAAGVEAEAEAARRAGRTLGGRGGAHRVHGAGGGRAPGRGGAACPGARGVSSRAPGSRDRKSTRLNSSHVSISYA